MADYAFLAVIMTKYDLNLAKVREDLVPDEINEDDFWCTKANTTIGAELKPYECT